MRTFICSLIVVWSSAFAMEADAQGIITGRVTDAGPGTVLASVQIYIDALDIGTLSQPNGNYLLLNVPVGTHSLTVQRIGYRTVTVEVAVGQGVTVTQSFALDETALQLDEIVVTGAGQATERRRLGNVISTIGPQEIEAMAPGTTLDALRTTVPGLIMFSGTSDGNAGRCYSPPRPQQHGLVKRAGALHRRRPCRQQAPACDRDRRREDQFTARRHQPG